MARALGDCRRAWLVRGAAWPEPTLRAERLLWLLTVEGGLRQGRGMGPSRMASAK